MSCSQDQLFDSILIVLPNSLILKTVCLMEDKKHLGFLCRPITFFGKSHSKQLANKGIYLLIYFFLLCWCSSAKFDFISVVFMNHLKANGDKFFDMLSVAKLDI